MLTINDEQLRRLARTSPEVLGPLVIELGVVDREGLNPKPATGWREGTMGDAAMRAHGAGTAESFTSHAPGGAVSYTILTRTNDDVVEIAEGEGWAIGRTNGDRWGVMDVEATDAETGANKDNDTSFAPWRLPSFVPWTHPDFDWEAQLGTQPTAVISRLTVCARIMRIDWAPHARIGRAQMERGIHSPQASMIEALEKALGIVTQATRHHTIGERLRTIEERLR